MNDKKITRKITQGVYALITNGGGCIVDAVSQVSAGDNPLISVAVLKNNYTHNLIEQNKIFSISVLSENVDSNIIKIFGLNSMRDIDKFANVKCSEINGVKIIDDSIGYMICEVVDSIDTGTHTLYIGRIIACDKYNDEIPMSYAYYQEHKDELIKIRTKKGETAWVCTICGYVYYGESLPEGFTCPMCGVDASLFELKK